MKKILLIFCLILLPVLANAQVEKGDTEISFLGYYSTLVGIDGGSSGFGSIQFSYGYFLTPNLQFGLGPTVSFSGGSNNSTDVTFSGSGFLSFNFSTSSKSVPYLTVQWYQRDFDIPEGEKFTDLSYINVGLGVRSFFSEYAALNSSVNYGFSLRENSEGGLLIIQSGLSFIF